MATQEKISLQTFYSETTLYRKSSFVISNECKQTRSYRYRRQSADPADWKQQLNDCNDLSSVSLRCTVQRTRCPSFDHSPCAILWGKKAGDLSEADRNLSVRVGVAPVKS